MSSIAWHVRLKEYYHDQQDLTSDSEEDRISSSMTLDSQQESNQEINCVTQTKVPKGVDSSSEGEVKIKIKAESQELQSVKKEDLPVVKNEQRVKKVDHHSSKDVSRKSDGTRFKEGVSKDSHQSRHEHRSQRKDEHRKDRLRKEGHKIERKSEHVKKKIEGLKKEQVLSKLDNTDTNSLKENAVIKEAVDIKQEPAVDTEQASHAAHAIDQQLAQNTIQDESQAGEKLHENTEDCVPRVTDFSAGAQKLLTDQQGENDERENNNYTMEKSSNDCKQEEIKTDIEVAAVEQGFEPNLPAECPLPSRECVSTETVEQGPDRLFEQEKVTLESAFEKNSDVEAWHKRPEVRPVTTHDYSEHVGKPKLSVTSLVSGPRGITPVSTDVANDNLERGQRSISLQRTNQAEDTDGNNQSCGQ